MSAVLRAMAFAELLRNAASGLFEIEEGTLATVGGEMLADLQTAKETFEQLLRTKLKEAA